MHWDDDDWYAPWRIRYQVEQFLRADADVAGLATVLYWDSTARLAWRYRYPAAGRPWVHDPTFCYRRSYWERHPFPNASHALDTTWLWRGAAPRRVLALADSRFYVGIVHPGNTSPKRMAGPWWERRPVEEVLDLVGDSPVEAVGGVAR
jgi:hypothetical protein